MVSENQRLFIEILQAGLWEKEVGLSSFGELDCEYVFQLAQEQSVVGLVAAGLEHVVDVNIPQNVALLFAGTALQLEQRNKEMNVFLGRLVEKMRALGIYTILLKGQGVAQCYNRPLWRSCGDIDFFLSEDNYLKAKEFLTPLATSSRVEGDLGDHQEMIIGQWIVELHGDFRNGLSYLMDKVLKEIKDSIIYKGNVRSWMNGETQIFLPAPLEDSIFVFTHIIKHLFKGGIGLRQICDWCRLLWCYRTEIDLQLLETKIKMAGLMSEWRVFATMAVEYLGMPKGAMPFYSTSDKLKNKSERLLSYIIYSGNFGHNKDISYQSKYKGLARKTISFFNQVKDSFRLAVIFPMDAFRFLFSYTALKTTKSLKKHNFFCTD